MKGDVPKTTIRRESSCQGRIEQGWQGRVWRRANTPEQINVPGFASRQRTVEVSTEAFQEVFDAMIELGEKIKKKGSNLAIYSVDFSAQPDAVTEVER